MLKNKFLMFLGAVLILATSCKDENLAPIATFDAAEKGAYPALIEETVRDINLFDIAGSSYNYTIEFVDLEKGNLVSEYALQLTYEDGDPSDGDNSAGPIEFKSWPASSFETNSNGFKGISNINITASEAMAAFGLSDLGPGDIFRFTGRVTTTSGQSFMASNSSAAVNGAAFRGHFNFNLTAICPSALEGTYQAISTGIWCGADDGYETTVTLSKDGKTAYDVDDFSFGAYDPCYGAGAGRPLGNLRLVDVCNKISVTGASQWGEVYTYSDMSVDGNSWKFTWVNDYGEGATTELINPAGWPPLELK